MLLIAETVSKVEKINKVEPFSMMNMLNTVIGLVVVIALILALAWAVKKYGRLPNNSQADMKILGGLSLGTREKAVLIEVEGKKLLLGVAPGRIETLYVLDGTHSSGSEFNKNLNDAMEAS
jgi:flagellar protein FliO/FliZ